MFNVHCLVKVHFWSFYFMMNCKQQQYVILEAGADVEEGRKQMGKAHENFVSANKKKVQYVKEVLSKFHGMVTLGKTSWAYLKLGTIRNRKLRNSRLNSENFIILN